MSAAARRVVDESLLFVRDRLIASSKVNFRVCQEEEMILQTSMSMDPCLFQNESVHIMNFEVEGNDCFPKVLELKICPAPKDVCLEKSWTSEKVGNTLFVWTKIERCGKVCLLLKASSIYKIEAVVTLRGRLSNIETIEVLT